MTAPPSLLLLLLLDNFNFLANFCFFFFCLLLLITIISFRFLVAVGVDSVGVGGFFFGENELTISKPEGLLNLKQRRVVGVKELGICRVVVMSGRPTTSC